MSESKREQLLPWTGAIGVGVALLGVVAIVNGTPAGLIAVLIGLGMVVVGALQKLSRQRQQQHDELMAQMRRQSVRD